jgi:GT2 family glycosyltransferase
LNLLSVVILNYNGKGFLEKFLPLVIEHANGHEIIVADNCSTDASVPFLKENFPHIRLIQNQSNGGFAKGYNDALKFVESEFYILLNSDIEVSENWIAPLLEEMKNPKVAGCQPKILSYQNKNNFEHAGASGGFLDKDYFPFCRGRIFQKIEEDKGQYNNALEVFWATGAALLIRAELYHKAGGLDEDFFAHMEEIDLCWRLKKQNFQFKVVPQSVVYHVGGGTLDYSSPFKTYLNFRNSLFMIIKNHEGWLFPKLLRRLVLDGIAGIRFLVRGEMKQLGSILKAHFAVYSKFGLMLKKRKMIRSQSTEFNAVGLYQGSILWDRYVLKRDEFHLLSKSKF